MNEQEQEKLKESISEEVKQVFNLFKFVVEKTAPVVSVSAIFNLLQAILLSYGMDQESSFIFVRDYSEEYSKRLCELIEKKKDENASNHNLG